MVRFPLEVEERHELDIVSDCVGHDALAVDTEEAAAVAGVTFLQNQFFVAQVQEFGELSRVTQLDDQVFGGKGLLAVVAVRVSEVDLVKQFAFHVSDVIASYAMAGVDFGRQRVQIFGQKFSLHHSHGRELFSVGPEDVGDVVLFNLAPSEPTFFRVGIGLFSCCRQRRRRRRGIRCFGAFRGQITLYGGLTGSDIVMRLLMLMMVMMLLGHDHAVGGGVSLGSIGFHNFASHGIDFRVILSRLTFNCGAHHGKRKMDKRTKTLK